MLALFRISSIRITNTTISHIQSTINSLLQQSLPYWYEYIQCAIAAPNNIYFAQVVSVYQSNGNIRTVCLSALSSARSVSTMVVRLSIRGYRQIYIRIIKDLALIYYLVTFCWPFRQRSYQMLRGVRGGVGRAAGGRAASAIHSGSLDISAFQASSRACRPLRRYRFLYLSIYLRDWLRDSGCACMVYDDDAIWCGVVWRMYAYARSIFSSFAGYFADHCFDMRYDECYECWW